jgi:hypothetical protein
MLSIQKKKRAIINDALGGSKNSKAGQAQTMENFQACFSSLLDDKNDDDGALLKPIAIPDSCSRRSWFFLYRPSLRISLLAGIFITITLVRLGLVNLLCQYR